MLRVCFIEMEGVLLENNSTPQKSEEFVKQLTFFCKEKEIKLILLSGIHEKAAVEKFNSSFLKKYFSDEDFFYVDENYINSKSELDKKLYLKKLHEDSSFEDSFSKQVFMTDLLSKNSFSPKEALLLCNDVWVDAYYTTRFSKVNFALFMDNLKNRNNPADLISGLIYFTLNFSEVISILESFPLVDTTALEKLVFEEIKKSLIPPEAMSSIINKRISQLQDKGETK